MIIWKILGWFVFEWWVGLWNKFEIRQQVDVRLPRGDAWDLYPLLVSIRRLIVQILWSVWLWRKSLNSTWQKTPKVQYGFFIIKPLIWYGISAGVEFDDVWLIIFVGFEDKQEMDQQREQLGKEASEVNALKRVSDDIIPHILNLWVAWLPSSPLPQAVFYQHMKCKIRVTVVDFSIISFSMIFVHFNLFESTIWTWWVNFMFSVNLVHGEGTISSNLIFTLTLFIAYLTVVQIVSAPLCRSREGKGSIL